MKKKSKTINKNVKKTSESDLIWNKIQDIDLGLYGLPNQLIKNHTSRLKFSNTEVHLKLKSNAVLPLLESMVTKLDIDNKQINIEETDSFIILSLKDKEKKNDSKIKVSVRALDPME